MSSSLACLISGSQRYLTHYETLGYQAVCPSYMNGASDVIEFDSSRDAKSSSNVCQPRSHPCNIDTVKTVRGPVSLRIRFSRCYVALPGQWANGSRKRRKVGADWYDLCNGVRPVN